MNGKSTVTSGSPHSHGIEALSKQGKQERSTSMQRMVVLVP